MILTLVTPPVGPVVALPDLITHLRVDQSDEHMFIAGLEAAAVGYLDGWGGILGRAINTQVWRQEFDAWGALELALPDVSAVQVTYLDVTGEEQPATTAVLRTSAVGQVVDATGPAATRIFVNMTCAMSAQKKPVVQTLIKMLVANWYSNREPVIAGSVSEVPMAAQALISALCWRRV